MSGIKGMTLVNRALLVILLLRTTDDVAVTALLYAFFLLTCMAAMYHTFGGD